MGLGSSGFAVVSLLAGLASLGVGESVAGVVWARLVVDAVGSGLGGVWLAGLGSSFLGSGVGAGGVSSTLGFACGSGLGVGGVCRIFGGSYWVTGFFAAGFLDAVVAGVLVGAGLFVVIGFDGGWSGTER